MTSIFFTDIEDQPRAVQISVAIMLRGSLPGIDDEDLVVALVTGLPGGHFNMCDGGVSEQHLLNALVQGPHFRGIRLSSIVFAWADETGFWKWSFNAKVPYWSRLRHKVVRGNPYVKVAELNLLPMPKAWESILRSYFPGNPMERTK